MKKKIFLSSIGVILFFSGLFCGLIFKHSIYHLVGYSANETFIKKPAKKQTTYNHKKITKKPVSSNNPKQVTIRYDNYGFTPNILSVPLGTKITIINTSNGPMIFQGLPGQPNNNPELNLGIINQGQTKSFIANEQGVWQFQNGNESSDRGNLTVT